MKLDNKIPIYVQVAMDMKQRIIAREFKPGEKLYSTRELASYYSINPNTAQRVYKQLIDENVCIMKRGLGTFVIEDKELIDKIRNELALDAVRVYLSKIEKLGFSKKDAFDFMKEERGLNNANTRN